MKLPLLHPSLVHFPIAFYFLEMLLLLFWVVKKDEAYRRFALFSFRTAYLFMIVAVVAGLVDTGGISGALGHKVRPHFLSAVSLFTISTVRAFYWRFGRQEQPGYARFLVGGAILATLIVALTGFFGGEIVYG